MKLGLHQILTLEQNDSSSYYRSAHKIEGAICDENFTYVVAPGTLLKKNGESKLGFSDDEKIFVNKNLPIGIIPYVALFQHYMNMDNLTLTEKLGYDFVNADDCEKKNVLIANIMVKASEYVRDDEMIEFYHAVLDEPDIEREFIKQSLPKMTSTISNRSIDALVASENKKLDHYLLHRRNYLKAYESNKYNRLSTKVAGLIGQNMSFSKLMGDHVVQSDFALLYLIKNSEFSEQIIGITQQIQKLSYMEAGAEISLEDRFTNRVMYEILESVNAKNPPFEYIEEDCPSNKNVIRITEYGTVFFNSLHKKLSSFIMSEQNALEEMMSSASKQLPGRDVSFSIKKDQIPIIHELLRQTRFIVAKSPEIEQKVIELGHARSVLQKYNLSVAEIDENILRINQPSIELKSAVNGNNS